VSVVIVVYYEVVVSASGLSLVQRSPTKCGVSECNRLALVMRSPWPGRRCSTVEGKYKKRNIDICTENSRLLIIVTAQWE
jgi:hypothetical protein